MAYGWRKPTAGWCFGSKVLTVDPGCLYDFLPPRDYAHIANRWDFWTAWVLDVLCGHTDHRQALFMKLRSGLFQAFFIDHGHLFGGPDGLLRDSHSLEPFQYLRPRYLDPEIYAQPAQRDVDNIVKTIQHLDVAKLAHVVRSLPKEWKKASSAESVGGFRFGQFSKRVIECHFHRFEGTKSVRPSGYHTNFVIEALDRAA